jgi:hypothetical protein
MLGGEESGAHAEVKIRKTQIDVRNKRSRLNTTRPRDMDLHY